MEEGEKNEESGNGIEKEYGRSGKRTKEGKRMQRTRSNFGRSRRRNIEEAEKKKTRNRTRNGGGGKRRE